MATPLFYLMAPGTGGVPYITFVGPALLASAAISVAFEETAFPAMAGFKWSREFYAMNATVIGPGQVLSGVLLAVQPPGHPADASGGTGFRGSDVSVLGHLLPP